MTDERGIDWDGLRDAGYQAAAPSACGCGDFDFDLAARAFVAALEAQGFAVIPGLGDTEPVKKIMDLVDTYFASVTFPDKMADAGRNRLILQDAIAALAAPPVGAGEGPE